MEQDTSSDEDDTTDTALSGVFHGETSSAGSLGLKKGPWSEEEDVILKDYVEKNGEGNWNAVQIFSGLSRSGKSCRLRWKNHLRPYLKKCPFSPEEERLIFELHAKLGSKWSQMAAKLPGRSDNEIKNFWNTRYKRLQREGLPVYPPDVRVERQTESPQSPEPTPFPSGNISSSHGFLDVRYYEIAEFKIPKNPIPRTFSSPAFLDFPQPNMLPQVPKPNPSYRFSNMFSIFHPQGPTPSFKSNYMLQAFDPPGLDTSHSFNHMYHTTGLTERFRESSLIGTSFPGQSNRDPNLAQHQLLPQPHAFHSITDNPTLCFSPNSHAHMNSSNPSQLAELNFGSMMMELPSIQKLGSDFSFDSDLIRALQADRSMLQPIPTHCQIIDPAENITDGFFNLDDELETYEQHDPFIGPSDPNTCTHPMPLQEYPTAAQISADPSMLQPVATHHQIIDPAEKITDGFFNFDADTPIGPSDPNTCTHPMPLQEYPTAKDTKAHEVPAGLISRSTVPDSGKDYSYQIDTSAAPNGWLDGYDYAMLDEAMAAFISDEDVVTLTPKDP